MQEIEAKVDRLRDKIKILTEVAWQERGMKKEHFDQWIKNFTDIRCGAPELQQGWAALHLLSKFLYFSDELIRKLLAALYRDKIRTPLIHEIRRAKNNTLDEVLIEGEYQKELAKARFLGMGNPSESGCHLLYYFRQENELRTELFVHGHEALLEAAQEANRITRYVFIDDFCGTGKQATRYARELVAPIKGINPESQVWYFPLVGTKSGLEKIRTDAGFDRTESVLEFDDSFKCFSEQSRYFESNQTELKQISRNVCEHYGSLLAQLNDCEPLGFGDCQLLIGFHHNTPNNTLPIFWASTDRFTPIFHRYSKIY